MFSWLSKDASRKKEPEAYATVADGLKKLYKQKMLPLEEFFKFHDFHSPPLDDPDFDAKPMVLLVGQYSTGKTTFIRYLLEQVQASAVVHLHPHCSPTTFVFIGCVGLSLPQ